MIYNKPVNVSGLPRLSFVLDSANDTASWNSYAYYDASFDIGMYVRSFQSLVAKNLALVPILLRVQGHSTTTS